MGCWGCLGCSCWLFHCWGCLVVSSLLGVVPAVVLAGGGVLAGCGAAVCGAGVPCWKVSVVFVAAWCIGWLVMERERKGKNKIKINIPTQNIIYPPLEGGIYNITKFLQK